MVLSFVQLAILIHYQPFRTRKQNTLKIVCEILFVTAHFALLVLPVFEKYASILQVKVLSWGACILFLLSFILELLFQLIYKSKKK